MPGVKGEAVAGYAEPLTTKQMQHTRLSWRVRNMDVFLRSLDVTNSEFDNIAQNALKHLISIAFELILTCLLYNVGVDNNGFTTEPPGCRERTIH